MSSGKTTAMTSGDQAILRAAQCKVPLISLRDVSLNYGAHRALNAVSLDLFAGEIFVLMGPNGAGKSSLVKVLTGAIRPDSGTVEDGPGLAHGNTRRAISLVPQDIALYSWLTARENCIAFARIGGASRSDARKRAAQALALTHCSDVGDVPIIRLSGGYKRRINIAAALSNEPALIILDEPTVGVDLDAKRTISQLLLTLKELGTAIVIVTHDFPEADFLSDRAGFLQKGRLLKVGAPKAMVEEEFGIGKSIDIVLHGAPSAEQGHRLQALGIRPTPINTVWSTYRRAEGWDASAFATALDAQGLAIREMTLRDPGLETLYLHYCRDEHQP